MPGPHLGDRRRVRRPAPADKPATIAINHPQAGLIGLQMFQLRLVDQPDLVMVVQVPANGTYLARVNSLLAGHG